MTIPTADIAIKRVAERAKHGGHNVPENVIRRRYEAGWRNFEAHYRHAADSWIVYDNAAKVPRVTQWGDRK